MCVCVRSGDEEQGEETFSDLRCRPLCRPHISETFYLTFESDRENKDGY